LIGFADRAVIEQTVPKRWPEGFRRSDSCSSHAPSIFIVDRREMRDKLANVMHAAAQAACGSLA